MVVRPARGKVSARCGRWRRPARACALAWPLGLLILGASVPASAATCPAPARAPEVRVVAESGALRVDNTMDRTALGAYARETGLGLGPSLDRPLGLTNAEVVIELSTESRTSRAPDGSVCVWLEAARIAVRFQAFVVHVAREYRPGSCEHRAVLEHERTHVAISRDSLARHLPRLERAAAEALAARPALRVRDVEEAREAYTTYLNERLAPILRDWDEAQRQANARIDTPEGYRALRRQCDDW